MCGIVGYVGDRPVQELLLQGLQRLEYRGYDSAGVSVLADGEIATVRAVGNLANLHAAVAERDASDGRVATAARRRARPASPTPAGPRTGASPRPTPTR
jgi:glucosamine--fructose-6-phosphate aminotransferase (isomerizing)